MGLERDEGGRGMLGRVLKVPDHVEVAEVHSVEAADRERDRPDRLLREPDVDLQISTLDPLLWVAGLRPRFSGKLARQAGLWPCFSGKLRRFSAQHLFRDERPAQRVRVAKRDEAALGVVGAHGPWPGL